MAGSDLPLHQVMLETVIDDVVLLDTGTHEAAVHSGLINSAAVGS